MAGLALEQQERSVLLQHPSGALEYGELVALHVAFDESHGRGDSTSLEDSVERVGAYRVAS
jgi:hypothetical protein